MIPSHWQPPRVQWFPRGAEARRLILRLLPGLFCVVACYAVALLSESIPVRAAAVIVGAGTIFAYAFVEPDLLIIVLIGAMLLSPEIGAGSAGTRQITLRIEDFLIFFIFMAWLARATILREGLRRSPIDLPIIGFAVANIVATLWAAMRRPGMLTGGFFYCLKMIEYNVIYFLVLNNIRSRRQIGLFLGALLVTAVITGGIAAAELGQGGRATAPFEGVEGEPNTLGGYLMLILSLCVGLWLMARRPLWKLLLLLPIGFLYYPFVNTFSRSSYAAFAASLGCMFLLYTAWTKRLWWVVLIPLTVAVQPLVFPQPFVDRATSLEDQSAASRLNAWKLIPSTIENHPILGYGVTGVGLVDSQYPRVFGETGLVGTAMFIWLLFSIAVVAYRGSRQSMDPLPSGLKLGFLGGFVGVLVHCIGANTFLIVRIMEPFWFLTGMMAALNHLEDRGLVPLAWSPGPGVQRGAMLPRGAGR